MPAVALVDAVASTVAMAPSAGLRYSDDVSARRAAPYAGDDRLGHGAQIHVAVLGCLHQKVQGAVAAVVGLDHQAADSRGDGTAALPRGLHLLHCAVVVRG